MEYGEALRRRRMVRRHTGDPVPADALDRILAAGAAAPTAGNAQGVSFVAVTDPDRIRAVAAACREDAFVAAGRHPWLSTAGAIVAICLEPAVYRERYGRPDKDPAVLDAVPWWWVDGGAALMAILLAAVDEGLGAGFLGGHACPGLPEVLALPDGVILLGVVTLGPVADAPAPRIHREGRIHRDTW